MKSSPKINPKRFLWHLEQPYIRIFSHDHWWIKSLEKVEYEAAVWEILRRHPNTEMLLLASAAGGNIKQIVETLTKSGFPPYWEKRRNEFVKNIRLWNSKKKRLEKSYDEVLLGYAENSWDKLPAEQKKKWKEYLSYDLKPQFGFKPNRPDVLEIFPSVETINNLMEAVMRVKKKSDRPKLWSKLWDQECENAAPIVPFYWGNIHIRFDPSEPDIEKKVKNCVQVSVDNWRKLFPKLHAAKLKGRARANKWLKIIKLFEESKLSLGKKQIHDDQDFARYYRIIGKWDF